MRACKFLPHLYRPELETEESKAYIRHIRKVNAESLDIEGSRNLDSAIKILDEVQGNSRGIGPKRYKVQMLSDLRKQQLELKSRNMMASFIEKMT